MVGEIVNSYALYFAILGSFLMGFVVMWICFFILNRIKDFSASAFGEIIVALFGGTILTVYTTTLSDAVWVFWIYPIGLIVGMAGYFLAGGNVKATVKAAFNMREGATVVTKPAGTSVVQALSDELQDQLLKVRELEEFSKKHSKA